jgi:DNA repair photolyase
MFDLRHPVSIITKNALIQRDVDILQDLASLDLVHVMVSVTTLDRDLARTMEPRTSPPQKRLETIEFLASRGIPVSVNAAPVIPGLNDVEIPSILKAASDRGALGAGYLIIRLPYAVKDLFLDWLKRELPEKASRVESRIRSVRGGKLTDSEFGIRMSGRGKIAEAIEQLFASSCDRYGLNKRKVELRMDLFTRNRAQLTLF